jgi:hypothetical protein
MKYAILFTASLWLSGLAYAHPGESVLTLRSALQRPVHVYVDGYPIAASGTLNGASGIVPGLRRIEVFAQRTGFRQQPGALIRLYSQPILVRPRHEVELLVSRSGRVYLEQQPAGFGFLPEEEFGQPGVGFQPWMPAAMQEADYNGLMRALKAEAFEDTRLKLAERVLGRSWVSTAQVAGLMGLFYFDDNRLELARLAYPRVTDPGRYFSLTETLTFNENREALLRLMR